MTRALATVTMVAALALCAPASAAEPEHATTTEPFETVVVNPCNGEEILLVGTLTARFNAVVDARGGTHRTETFNVRASGTGTYGNRYRYVRNSGQTSYWDVDGTPPSLITGYFHDRVLGQAGAPSFILRLTVQYITNANGEPVVQRAATVEECR